MLVMGNTYQYSNNIDIRIYYRNTILYFVTIDFIVHLTLYNVFPTQTTHPPHRALSCPKPPFHHTELYSQHNMTIQVQHSKLSLLHNTYNMYTVILLAIAQVYNLEGYGQTSGIIGHAG